MNILALTKSAEKKDEFHGVMKLVHSGCQKKILCFENELSALDYHFFWKFAEIAIIDSETCDIHLAHRLKFFSPGLLLIYLDSNQQSELLSAEAYRIVVTQDQLKDALDAAIHRLSQCEPIMFTYIKNKITNRIDVNRILYLWTDKRKRYYKLEGGESDYFYENMEALDKRLELLGFVRVSKSYIVNLKHVIDIKKDSVIMSDGVVIKCTGKWKNN